MQLVGNFLQAGLGALLYDLVQNCDMLRLQRWWSATGTA
jgi:hypothetical protein